MGKHVDTTRTPDDEFGYDPLADWERGLLGYDWPRANHRKPGWPAVTYIPDVWSGNPDTDKAWAK